MADCWYLRPLHPYSRYCCSKRIWGALGCPGRQHEGVFLCLRIPNCRRHSFASIFNAVITISTLSVANSCTYGSTLTLQALAQHNMTPKFLAYVDKIGRPVVAIILQLLFGLLAFISLSAQAGALFTWLFSISGLGILFLCGSICLSYIRFRQWWKSAGRSVEDRPFKSPLGIYGSYFALLLLVFILALTFYVALIPPGESTNAQYFFQNWLSG